MGDLYTIVTRIFYQLSLAFFWPVAIALLVLFTLCLFDLGALAVQAWRRRKEPRTDLARVAQVLARGLADGTDGDGTLAAVPMSSALRRFWNHVETRLAEAGSREHLDLWLEETLQNEEIELTSRLDRSRAYIRIGPMLGLAGTIIPLGPALHSLLGGNMGEMVDHLVIGFGAVVVGLVTSGAAYFITLIRERWTRVELKDMENLCELLVRTLQQEEPSERSRYARVHQA